VCEREENEVFAVGRGRLYAGGYLETTIALSLLLNAAPSEAASTGERCAQVDSQRRQAAPDSARSDEGMGSYQTVGSFRKVAAVWVKSPAMPFS